MKRSQSVFAAAVALTLLSIGVTLAQPPEREPGSRDGVGRGLQEPGRGQGGRGQGGRGQGGRGQGGRGR